MKILGVGRRCRVPIRAPTPSYMESSPFVDALRAAFAVVETVPVSFVNDLVDEEHTDWLFLAHDGARVSPGGL